jgi:hypothetical protein
MAVQSQFQGRAAMKLQFETAEHILDRTGLDGAGSLHAKSAKAGYLVMGDQTGRSIDRQFYASFRRFGLIGRSTMVEGPGPNGSFPSAAHACLALQKIEDGN